MGNRGYNGPLPSVDFRRQVADEVMPPLQDSISGEVNASAHRFLGIARFRGLVSNYIASVAKSGKDDSSVPKMTFDIRVNGSTVFSTKPAIAHVSGETSQFKTTWDEASDTGITAGVFDEDANAFDIGDILSVAYQYSGNASPTTKMNNPSILVEVTPKPSYV